MEVMDYMQYKYEFLFDKESSSGVFLFVCAENQFTMRRLLNNMIIFFSNIKKLKMKGECNLSYSYNDEDKISKCTICVNFLPNRLYEELIDVIIKRLVVEDNRIVTRVL